MSHHEDSFHHLAVSFPSPTGDAFEDSRNIQDLVSSLGFDWPGVEGVIEKVKEELGEIQEALDNKDIAHAQKELGDVLFAIVNLSRFLNTDSRTTLDETNKRFVQRFVRMERYLSKKSLSITACSFDVLNDAWEKVKNDDQ